MSNRTTKFVKSGTRPAHYPASDLPEIAFAGRSNVGKSSLMNSLMGRKALVKVSGTPGRTQLLSWFEVDERLLLCDLPYSPLALIHTRDRVRASWGEMIETYLARRSTLLALAVIADVRRGFEAEERQLVQAAAGFGLHVVLVVTKCDKLKSNALYTAQRRIAKDMAVDPDTDIIWYSSQTGLGREAMWRRIDALLPSVDAG